MLINKHGNFTNFTRPAIKTLNFGCGDTPCISAKKIADKLIKNEKYNEKTAEQKAISAIKEMEKNCPTHQAAIEALYEQLVEKENKVKFEKAKKENKSVKAAIEKLISLGADRNDAEELIYYKLTSKYENKLLYPYIQGNDWVSRKIDENIYNEVAKSVLDRVIKNPKHHMFLLENN